VTGLSERRLVLEGRATVNQLHAPRLQPLDCQDGKPDTLHRASRLVRVGYGRFPVMTCLFVARWGHVGAS